jgi:hypothetical protein
MIGPASETGRKMMSSLQQAMSKGMPVDQAIAYVKTMARDGVAPLVDLYALMKQFERMKQQPVQPMQTPNIREQLSGLEAAMQQRQAAPQQNPQAMMGQGLGGLNAGAMENPSFAGGGIVAFDKGGPARTTAPQLYSDIPKFDTYEQMRAANIARLGQDPTQFEETEAERIRKANEARGLGEFAPSMTLRERLLAEDKAAAEKLAEEESALDKDEYWGDVAANASERGATLLTSLAKAQKGKASRKRATADKIKKATREAKLSEIALAQVKELEKAGRYKEADALRKTIYADIEKASGKIADASAAETAADAAHKRALELKRTEGPIDALERERRKLGKLKPGTPEFDEQSEKIDAMSMTPGRMPSQYSSSLAAARKALDTAKRVAVDFEGKPIPNDPRVKAAEVELRRVEQYIISRGYDIPGVSPMGAPAAGGDAASNLSDEQLRKELGI